MKLTKYIEKLQELFKEHGNLELIYSKDDEGNGYQTVNCEPSLVNYISSDREVIHEDDLEEWDETEYQKVICIN
jgi:hypothetical protein